MANRGKPKPAWGEKTTERKSSIPTKSSSTPANLNSGGARNAKSAAPTRQGDRLLVVVRVRPLKKEERVKGGAVVRVADKQAVVLVEPEGDKNDILRQKRATERQYVFDASFGDQTSQEEVYMKTTAPLVANVLEGYNATVFAYGATGAGKTHTMVGTLEQPGVMVRALNALFDAKAQAMEQQDFQISLSYLEIYNENIRDLLRPGPKPLELREDTKEHNVTVAGLSVINTSSTEEVMRLLTRGNKARTVEPTAANQTSSRSHALLQITVKVAVKMADGRGANKIGRLYMVDLAGSERAAQTKNEGKRLKEGAHINRSLLALGNVINALAGGTVKYVNFRDSKLTRLLREALTGNCRTVMIAHVSPAALQREETRNTLVYADRAKNITSKTAKPNALDVTYHVAQYQTMISELRQEINRMQAKIEDSDDMESVVSEPVVSVAGGLRNSARKRAALQAAQQEELKTLRQQLIDAFQEQMRIRHELLEVDGHILSLALDIECQNVALSELEGKAGKRIANRVRKSRSNGERRSSDPDEDSGNELDREEDRNYEDLQRAWDYLLSLRSEQQELISQRRELEQSLHEFRKRSSRFEEELPRRMTTLEQREVLKLLCKVHELEIEKIEMETEGLIQEHELRKRDLLLLRFDRQKTLSDEIIKRQKAYIDSLVRSDRRGMVAVPSELRVLYAVYEQSRIIPPIDQDPYNLIDMRHSKSSGNIASRPTVTSAGLIESLNLQGVNKLPPISRTGSMPSTAPNTPSSLLSSLETKSAENRKFGALPPLQPYKPTRSKDDGSGDRSKPKETDLKKRRASLRVDATNPVPLKPGILKKTNMKPSRFK